MSGIKTATATISLGPINTITTQGSGTSQTIAIVVGAIGAAMFVSLICLGELFLWRMRRRLYELRKLEVVDKDGSIPRLALVPPHGYTVSGLVDTQVPGSEVAAHFPQVYNTVLADRDLRTGTVSPVDVTSLRSISSVHSPSSFGAPAPTPPVDLISDYRQSPTIHPPLYSPPGAARDLETPAPTPPVDLISDYRQSPTIDPPLYSPPGAAGSSKLSKNSPEHKTHPLP